MVSPDLNRHDIRQVRLCRRRDYSAGRPRHLSVEPEASMGELDTKAVLSALAAANEAVGVYDADDCLIAFNDCYARVRSLIGGNVALGVRWDDLVTESLRSGGISEAIGREMDWLRYRRRVRGAYSVLRRTTDNQYHLVTERRLSSGGIIVVWSNISALINGEITKPNPAGRARAARNTLTKDRRQAIFNFWASQGLSTRACTVLAFAGCETLADIVDLGQIYFKQQKNCGPVTLREIKHLIADQIQVPSVGSGSGR